MSWRRPLHSIATATPSLWGTLHQSSQKVLGTWYLMSQPNSFDHQGLCLPSVTFPHNWEAVSKKHAKISSRILKQVPLNNVALLLRPNQTLVAVDAIFKKSTLFSEWILLGCYRLWFKLSFQWLSGSTSNKVWIVSLQTCPDDYVVRFCWLPWFSLAQS